MEPTSENIYNALKSNNRNVFVRAGWLGPKDGLKSFYVNYINLPKENDCSMFQKGGATAENNRISFQIYEQKDGRFSVETSVCVFPRAYRLRKKTASLEVITKYIREHLEKIASEIAPKL